MRLPPPFSHHVRGNQALCFLSFCPSLNIIFVDIPPSTLDHPCSDTHTRIPDIPTTFSPLGLITHPLHRLLLCYPSWDLHVVLYPAGSFLLRWSSHFCNSRSGSGSCLYVNLHVLHVVHAIKRSETSSQARFLFSSELSLDVLRNVPGDMNDKYGVARVLSTRTNGAEFERMN